MAEYDIIPMSKYDQEKGEIYKLSNGLEIYVKDGFLFLPKIFKIENHQNEIEDFKPCGLYNIGGVCYMNAILQCFYYCKPLTEYFLKLHNNKNLGLISKGYYDFVKGLTSGNKGAAKNFNEAIIKNDDIFDDKGGNDSKDVAMLILSELHNELKPNEDIEKIKLERKVNYYDINDVYNEKMELIRMNGTSTIISETFNFFMKCEQQCSQKCQKYYKPYYTIETDNIIILDLETLFPRDNIKISVEDALKSYTSYKKIECRYCKKKSLYIKYKFCTLPKILILVLSRGYHNKFKCKIDFKETLDMNDYYESVDSENYINTKYNLIGATFAFDWNYEGTGHTVAFCKAYQNNNYYVFNDRSVRKTNINEIYGKMPYLLFYERA